MRQPWHGLYPHLLLAVLVATALAGCGFQLRGSATPILPAVRLNANPPFRYEVEHALRRSGIQVSSAESAPLVNLSDERVDYRILSMDARGTAREYEVVHTVHLAVQCGDQNLIPPTTLSASRNYTATETAWLGTQAEAQQAAEAAAQNLAGQILSRLAGVKTTHCPQQDAVPEHARVLGEPATE